MRTVHNQRGAFSLIELLVAIGVIAILIGIIMPCMSAARERGRQAVCMNNLRSIWTGILAYATVYDDRAPFMEDINLSNPNADPFDPDSPTTVGTVLATYVTPGSWRCPSANAGFPQSAGLGGWKMTYTFHSAGPVGEGVPFDENELRGTGSQLDPLLSNYVQFDGRPLKLLDGRRYVTTPNPAANYSGKYDRYWAGRWPLIRDTYIQREKPSFFSPRYPHRASLQGRDDLGNYRDSFQRYTNSSAAKTGFLGLFADGEDVNIMMTREAMQHPPGY